MPNPEHNPRLERVNFQLRATGLKGEQHNPLRSGVHTRGYLPHVKREGASYFVTFRLADSLPREVLLKYEAERAERLRRFHALKQATTACDLPAAGDTLEKIERDFRSKVEKYLDGNRGACYLRDPRIAGIMAEALRHFADHRYRLDAWVVMPNQVHAVLWPFPNHTLSEIVKSWKRHTAREANKLLGRTHQAFWQPEPFDHWIRNPDEHARCCRYVIENPWKASLCPAPEQWQWSSAWVGWNAGKQS